MNIKSADRIIVKSNDRMKIVLDWYIANRAWLDKEEFHAPLESGVIVLQEEMLDVAFEEKQGVVEIAIYPRVDNRPCPAAVIFDYDPRTFEATHYRFAPQLHEVKRDLLRMVILSDSTDEKAALKYHALMLFMAYYREVISVEETRLPPQMQHKSKKKKRQGKAVCHSKSSSISLVYNADLRLLKIYVNTCRNLNPPRFGQRQVFC